jgi:hypothetical protein
MKIDVCNFKHNGFNPIKTYFLKFRNINFSRTQIMNSYVWNFIHSLSTWIARTLYSKDHLHGFKISWRPRVIVSLMSSK